MKIFLAGATGALGGRLVPLLVDCGFDVVAMTRSPRKARALHDLGAEPVVADALSREAVMEAVVRSEPEVVIHQMTALTGVTSLRNFDTVFAQTNRLRTEGTDHLLSAAVAAGARRFIAQSYGNWNYEPSGTRAKTETDPFDPSPPAAQRRSLEAIRRLEAAVLGTTGIEGIALRYGNFYGPGTGIAEDGDLAALVRRRRLPIIGRGTGMWSFIHVDDAATATLAAIERGAPGAYNVADDEPAAVADWLPELARALGAPPPRRVPAWIGRLAAGEVGVSMMTRIRGASNAKARRELGWRPRFPTFREGFDHGLGGAPAARAQHVGGA
jgi:2-alkyl-3-oxoalkanoate reductase